MYCRRRLSAISTHKLTPKQRRHIRVCKQTVMHSTSSHQHPSHRSVISECNTTAGVCTLLGWGPFATAQEENNAAMNTSDNILPQVVNFTVLIKNAILFPVFNARFDNVGSPAQNISLKCMWNATTAPTCPVFTLGTIFQEVSALSPFRKSMFHTISFRLASRSRICLMSWPLAQ